LLKDLCEKAGIPLSIVQGANHSLETGLVLEDIKNLSDVMQNVYEFIKKHGGEE